MIGCGYIRRRHRPLEKATQDLQVLQAILKAELDRQHIKSIDLTPHFEQAYSEIGANLFLYGDGIHLSVDGHRVLSKALEEILAPGQN